MLVTAQCASYCRYGTCSQIVGDYHATFNQHDYDRQIEYIRRTPRVRDVLLSGSAPLILHQSVLEDLPQRLHAIPRVAIIRIGTRVPALLSQRITDGLVEVLRRFRPLWMNIHVNHPKEITPELARACAKEARSYPPAGEGLGRR